MALNDEQFLVIDDAGKELGLLTSYNIIKLCKQREIAAKAQVAKKGLFASYRPITDYPQFLSFVSTSTLQEEQQREAQRLYQAEYHPPSGADLIIRVNAEQRGPFTPPQIRTLWQRGDLPSDTLFYYDEIGDWKPVKSFCQAVAPAHWEYDREVVDISYWSTDANTALTSVLNVRGREGWELISVCPMTDTKFASATKTNQLVFFFKRQIG